MVSCLIQYNHNSNYHLNCLRILQHFIVSEDSEICVVFLTYSVVYRNIPAWFNCHDYFFAYTSIMLTRMWDTCMCGKFRTGIHPLTWFYFYGWLSILSIRMENPSKSWHFEFGWISIVDLTGNLYWSSVSHFFPLYSRQMVRCVVMTSSNIWTQIEVYRLEQNKYWHFQIKLSQI